MRALSIALLVLLVAAPAGARVYSRNYLTFFVGTDILPGTQGAPLIDGHTEGVGEIGIGHQVSKSWLVEFDYGYCGRWEEEPYEPLDAFMPPPPDDERVWRLTTNTLFLRGRWVRGGARTEYLKPELSAGLGFVQVTRGLRNYPQVPPYETSQLLVSGEVGAAALLVFSDTFMASLGARYRMTERRAIVYDRHHFDGISVLLGFRIFLPSPRDVEEPDPPQKPPEGEDEAATPNND